MPYNLKQLFQKHNVKGLSINSKTVKENDIFFAIKGQNVDGNDFINEVLNQAVALVITDNKKNTIIDDKVIYVEDVQVALYEAIEIFYPKKPKNLIAVTGTNGKSSVVSYIAQTYSLLGKKAASIGTIGVEIFGCDNLINDVPELTTLDYLSFRKIAHNLAENNIEYLAFEASSHGLNQARLGEIKVNTACFTSFSQDHLDYHHTKENYLLAKLKLFTRHLFKPAYREEFKGDTEHSTTAYILVREDASTGSTSKLLLEAKFGKMSTEYLLQGGLAILNSDIAEIEFVKDYLRNHNIKFITVGKKGDVQITKINGSLKAQNINFIFNNRECSFNTSIIGSFQASNLLIAALSIHYIGFDFNKIIEILTQVKPVKGRMERIGNTNIFVDYSHTPDALEKALTELKNVKLRDSRLNVVFGCGGNRDKTKRSLMGQIAARLADNVIITDDNPRHEDPKLIRAEIISGIEKADYTEIANREEAIKYGINNLKQDDILLIAGKGHENYQIIGDKKLPFDDAEIVRKLMSLRGKAKP
ncbi:UDP-N-acetylmuramyl-tripeptide synthetase family protein [Rickettsia felis str. Pedreira]|uniref:UDP-N-acetylmuramoyl-L-alanyl-D-glutamate--2,6-diaminopimelate ligase n=2 Tax=Rickettsia felis TaxID=42862 RepID=MURE_RICFE|nr:UDP-N-acetylmuramoyl-L-alanyl-D-glutamate--2,6-diaminopimelate ligase [Rickettsia felis]Q4UMI9.1 RecName: Full=UDP-N-acetylmuramoyl-L-alanyl-D-glutamate--2,6-diaminopimelate ligase; AltName: Full=Meso-A2pm-adding enzyme; AltName: Full=Meso-diaminopimelate-adding enzyme; AltName: Full=UDP-MurNAc-L-Ala-D-Glu:meso-diaminopimelate ligase; AltName: Full=UDP-MurNAc-tripeptide synthetase; AltName: Full=UDP-N-acetylmuramyl-tripeptide synthetase [Rickettsia felis URRWXCal2]AAY61219.1 UDP-N-acetylmuramo